VGAAIAMYVEEDVIHGPTGLRARLRRGSSSELRLRAGEWIEVRSAREILGTLDENQALDGLPFMPEMLQYCGKRFRVFKSAHKTCDTIEQYVVRRMAGAVHLENLRCDGAAHGGCQAGCLLFWKDAWLKRVSGPAPVGGVETREPSSELSIDDRNALERATRGHGNEADGCERYRCQATDLLLATSEVRRRTRWNPLFYVRDLTSGNVRVSEFLWYGLLAAANAFMSRWWGIRYPQVCGRAGQGTPTEALDLQVGERVAVRSKAEIVRTLNTKQRNRGLFFDVEMLPYCDRDGFAVLRRVDRIIDERNGRMLKMPNPCIILDGVTCGGKLSTSRMFCPRSIYPYWREIWLRRAAGTLAGLREGEMERVSGRPDM
jgi:hypothetical protein